MTFTTVDQSLLGPFQNAATTFVGMGRNRLVNGEMIFDQMNAGNVFNVNNVGYSLDQWFAQTSTGTISTQQLTTTPPTGFTNYVRVTVTSADASPAASAQYFMRNGGPEGTFTRDFLWGTANAKTVTMSFWVRSSLTGVFSFSFENSAHSRSYVATYIINNANTWEFKTLTIPGDTTGAWVTDSTGFGVRCKWDFGSGSTFQTTPGTWQGSQFNSAIGSVKLISTNGATWDLTGVQLEIGLTATPFEFKFYPVELSLCQRYFEKTYALGVKPGTVTSVSAQTYTGNPIGTNVTETGHILYKVPKRATPNIVLYNKSTGSSGSWDWRNSSGVSTARPTFVDSSDTNGFNANQQTNTTDLFANGVHWTADCGF